MRIQQKRNYTGDIEYRKGKKVVIRPGMTMCYEREMTPTSSPSSPPASSVTPPPSPLILYLVIGIQDTTHLMNTVTEIIQDIKAGKTHKQIAADYFKLRWENLDQINNIYSTHLSKNIAITTTTSNNNIIYYYYQKIQ